MLRFHELKEISCLKEMEYVNPQCGKRHAVRWPYVTETVEFRQWVHGNELLIVTSAVTVKPEYSLEKIVKEAVRAGLSGALILTGDDYVKEEELTSEIIDYANKHDFPLARISWTVPLVDILEEVSRAVMECVDQDDCKEELFQKMFQAETDGGGCGGPEEKDGWHGVYRIGIFHVRREGLQAAYGKVTAFCRKTGQIAAVTGTGTQIFCGFMGAETEHKTWEILLGELIVGKSAVEGFFSISEEKQGTGDFAAAYEEAVELEKILEAFQLWNRTVCYEESYLYRRIFYADDQKELKDHAEKFFHPLREHDQENHSELCRTLQVCVENNFNLAESAKQLFIHRNTMHYRVKQIQQLMKREWNSRMFRMDAEFAAFILEVCGNNRKNL